MNRNLVLILVVLSAGCDLFSREPLPTDNHIEAVARSLVADRYLRRLGINTAGMTKAEMQSAVVVNPQGTLGDQHVDPIGLYRHYAKGHRALQAIFVKDYSYGSLDPWDLCQASARNSRMLAVCERL